MFIPEPIYQTIPSTFLEAANFAQSENERLFMYHLVHCLGIYDKVDRQNTDNMKEAVNNYILDQVDDWMKQKDPAIIDGILDGNLKRLREAQSFITERVGGRQLFQKEIVGVRQSNWEKVLENHVKLIAAYSHILAITLPTF